MKAKILYIHPEKTGGLSIRDELSTMGTHLFIDEWEDYSKAVCCATDDFDVVGGHIPYSMFVNSQETRIKLLTIRDPFTRELSYFSYLKHSELVPKAIRQRFAHMSFEDFIKRNNYRDRICKLISGISSWKAALIILHAERFHILRQECLDSDFNSFLSLLGTTARVLPITNKSDYPVEPRTDKTDSLIGIHCANDVQLYTELTKGFSAL